VRGAWRRKRRGSVAGDGGGKMGRKKRGPGRTWGVGKEGGRRGEGDGVKEQREREKEERSGKRREKKRRR